MPTDLSTTAAAIKVTFMEHMVTALRKGENALLESPTGTGELELSGTTKALV